MQNRDAGGEGSDPLPSRIQRTYQPVQPTYAQSTTVPSPRARKPSLDDMGPGTDRPEPLRDDEAVSRIRKPSLDEMGSAANRPLPARTPSPLRGEGRGDEQLRGPHKPTLDEMGPHAERGLPVAGPRKPRTPTHSPPPGGEGLGVGGTTTAKKKHRHGRPRKTGRPGA
jgi:excinuclease ABC subunit B